MAGLQICVRMTDGISFSLSSHCHSNKGLIEGEGAPTREKKTLGQRTLGEGWKEAGREKGRASVLKRWYHSGCEPRPKSQIGENIAASPDCIPHVEAVQRLGTVCAASCQTNKRWQPVRDVDEFAADSPRLLQ